MVTTSNSPKELRRYSNRCPRSKYWFNGLNWKREIWSYNNSSKICPVSEISTLERNTRRTSFGWFSFCLIVSLVTSEAVIAAIYFKYWAKDVDNPANPDLILKRRRKNEKLVFHVRLSETSDSRFASIRNIYLGFKKTGYANQFEINCD